MDATLKVTKGKGHKVKGQGQIRNYVKSCQGYKSGTDDFGLHQTYAQYSYSCNVEGDKKVKVTRSKVKIKYAGIYKKNVWAINQEWMIGT